MACRNVLGVRVKFRVSICAIDKKKFNAPKTHIHNIIVLLSVAVFSPHESTH